MSSADDPPEGAAPPVAVAGVPRSSGKIMGTLHEFNPECETFTVYMERAAIFFAANDIPAAKKVPFLLTCIGGTTYGILRNLVAPGNPMDMSYEDLTHTLRVHFDPKPLVIVERFHLHKRDQSASESVAEYLAELRRLAAKCEFGTYLEEALRDRLVCGIRSDATRKKLLGEADLDLTKASQIATAMESAHTSAQSLKAPALLVASVEPGVDMSHTWAPGARSPPCNRCGISGHTAADCRFEDAVCHRCYKRGHLGRVCRSHRNPRGCGRSQRRQTHHVEAEPDTDEVVDLISTVYCLQIPKTTSPYVVTLEVNSKPLTMEVDTGAVVSLISHSTQKEQWTEQLEDDAYEWAVDGDPANSASPTSSRVAERRATPAPALEAQTSEPEDVVPDVAVSQPDVAPTDSSEAGSPSATGELVAQPRYPSRTRKPPDRLYAVVDEGTLSQ